MKYLKFRAVYKGEVYTVQSIMNLNMPDEYFVIGKGPKRLEVTRKDITLLTHPGLQDIEENDIYSGDILEAQDGTKYIVEYWEDKAGYVLDRSYFIHSTHKNKDLDCDVILDLHLKIIGNFHTAL